MELLHKPCCSTGMGRRWIALSERMLKAAQVTTPGLRLLRNMAFRIIGHVPLLQRPMLRRVAGLVE